MDVLSQLLSHPCSLAHFSIDNINPDKIFNLDVSFRYWVLLIQWFLLSSSHPDYFFVFANYNMYNFILNFFHVDSRQWNEIGAKCFD